MSIPNSSNSFLFSRDESAHESPHGSPCATIHPLWVRLTHWLNAVAVFIMIASGGHIYNASPLFGFRIPEAVTLGGWLGGALQWHFAGMWLLVGNGAFYLVMNLVSGRMARRFFPLTMRGMWRDLQGIRQERNQRNLCRYTELQRAAYLFVFLDIFILVISGLVLWKSVQFPLLRMLLGGYEAARRVHFSAMGLLAVFAVGHAGMALWVPRTLRSMIFGR